MKPAKSTDWKAEELPLKRATIALDRVFSAEEMRQIRMGVIPRQMEDKWFIYWKDSTLFFHRSWTGYCHYVVRFMEDKGSFRMFEADVNRDPEQHSQTNDKQDARLILYLIELLLLRKPAAFPGKGLSPEEDALEAWGLAGRAVLGKYPDSDHE